MSGFIEFENIEPENIQGSIWPRLPCYYERFLFFRINDVDAFKTQLKGYADKITNGEKCKEYLVNNEGTTCEAKERVDIPPEKREAFDAVNISFSYKGVEKLVMQYDETKLDDELHIRGQYADRVHEGPEDPNSLLDEYKPPSDAHPNNDSWRFDGLLIVAAQTQDHLIKTIGEVKCAFGSTIKLWKDKDKFEGKEGHVRNADGKYNGPGSLRGKEHFGFEDQISQPLIPGLDDIDYDYFNKHPKTPKPIHPGWIITGREGDNANQPAWAKDGSFLVFREFRQYVPEFNEFLKERSKEMSSFNDGTGEKLGAHLMGRWKNGSPVELDPDGTKPMPFSNDFDFKAEDPNAKNTKCPFAAHIRKMRPRADIEDSDSDSDEDEYLNTVPLNTVPADCLAHEARGIILRRSITFGPELCEVEKYEGKTTHNRGLYFLCYQSSIRNGFNEIMTRWASNAVFPPNKNVCRGPGFDPIISEKDNRDPSLPHMSIYAGPKDEGPYYLELGDRKLGAIPWIKQQGGEYFFTPSIYALKNTLVE